MNEIEEEEKEEEEKKTKKKKTTKTRTNRCKRMCAKHTQYGGLLILYAINRVF